MKSKLALAVICVCLVAAGFPGGAAYAISKNISKNEASCRSTIALQNVAPTARGGAIIWKSNWDNRAGREQAFWQGNHSQKGAALLVHYKAGAVYVMNSSVIEVRDSKCNLIGRMGRFPRCTNMGCGEHERWYLRGPGSTYDTVASIAKKASAKGAKNVILIQLNRGYWARVNSVFDNREQK